MQLINELNAKYKIGGRNVLNVDPSKRKWGNIFCSIVIFYCVFVSYQLSLIDWKAIGRLQKTRRISGDLEEKSSLAAIIAQSPKYELEPVRFFVSWNGVVTIVFSGWPYSVIDMKQSLESSLPNLKKEDFGSKWPKITLAVLKDNSLFDKSRLEEIRSYCDTYSEKLKSWNWKLYVDAVTISHYECRSQERVLSERKIFLADRRKNDAIQPLQVDLHETDDEPYLNVGNRLKHYRDPHIGASIVYRLQSIPVIIDEFIKNLPEYYEPLHDSSWHVTIRGIS